MTWDFLGRLRLENNWVLLPAINSEIFRVSHIQIPNSEGRYLKAAIAVGVESNGRFNPYKPKLLTYSEHPEIIPLQGFPKQLGIPRLAVQRLDDSPVNWDIVIEAFPTVNVQNNLVDEIISGINTSNMTTPSLDLIPSYQIVDNIGGSYKCGLFVPANPNRELLIIRTAKDPLHLFGDKFAMNEDGTPDYNQPLIFLEELDKKSEVEFKRSGRGIYKGAIYARQARNEEISYTEFSAVLPDS